MGGISSTSLSGTTVQSLKIKFNSGAYPTYAPYGYYGLLTLSAATQNLCGTGNIGLLNAYTNVSVTYTTSTPILILPDPVSQMAGQSMYLIRSGITTSNAITLKTFTLSLSNFFY